MMTIRRLWVPVHLVLGLVIAACSGPPQPNPSLPSPTAPMLPSPTLRTEQSSPTPLVVSSPVAVVPTAAPAATATNVPPAGPCTNRYAFVSDVSIPDGTSLPGGQVFTKTWRLRNTGTCTWENGYTLEFIRGEAMTTLPSVTVPRTGPGERVDLSVLLTAPTTSGPHQGFWALKNPQGFAFTPNLWVKIIVP